MGRGGDRGGDRGGGRGGAGLGGVAGGPVAGAGTVEGAKLVIRGSREDFLRKYVNEHVTFKCRILSHTDPISTDLGLFCVRFMCLFFVCTAVSVATCVSPVGADPSLQSLLSNCTPNV